MNIDTKRCREYAEMFSKLAGGNYVVEENYGDDVWCVPTGGAILVSICEGALFNNRHRLIEKPRTPQTVTVYVWKAANGSVFTTTTDINVYESVLLRTVEVSLDDDATTVPVNTAIPTAAAKSGIDWNALPAVAQWVAMDQDGQWLWYDEKKPYRRSSFWFSQGRCGDAGIRGNCDDWTQSLQQRPLTS